MARPQKRRIESGQTSGRVTPKGGHKPAARAPMHLDDDHPAASSRYTPPAHKMYKPSPIIVPIAMFAFFGIGLLMIVLNYAGVLPGADQGSGWYIMGGLTLILLGIITATQYR